MNVKKPEGYDFPLNLYRTLCFELDNDVRLPEEMNLDERKGLKYLIESMRNDEYKIVFLEAYKFKKTNPEIAKKYGFDTSRVRAMNNETIRRLCGSYCIRLIYGYEKFIAETSLEDTFMSKRAIKLLNDNGLYSLSDIRDRGQAYIRKIPTLGKAVYEEIISKTWYLWEINETLPLSKCQKEKVRTALKNKGWNNWDINDFIEYVEEGVIAE
ncbi:hypothetical protein SAMN04487770_12932 [Butyrivibrio sp. ob235]|uniref:hypothetical protein n=1 Tax=Butyrivibrio sp. ob235 TaxID=1761780 RepID=UPI0008C3953C|nr:hypothetical protein [Butyrivibrio sp. ob235]SEM22358.1 hypothetical protein SAMN04487770_12932 [Butyrivibrio sp. ob235]